MPSIRTASGPAGAPPASAAARLSAASWVATKTSVNPTGLILGFRAARGPRRVACSQPIGWRPGGRSADGDPDPVAPGVIEPELGAGVVGRDTGDLQAVREGADVVPGGHLDQHLAQAQRVAPGASTAA